MNVDQTQYLSANKKIHGQLIIPSEGQHIHDSVNGVTR